MKTDKSTLPPKSYVNLGCLVPVSCPDIHTMECVLSSDAGIRVTLRRVHNGFNVHLVVIVHIDGHEIKLHDSPFSSVEKDLWVRLFSSFGDGVAASRCAARSQALRRLLEAGVFTRP